MSRVSSKNIHWDYYTAIENDVYSLSRFVELHENNFNTYSIEMVRLLLAASSEVDVVIKSLCREVEPESNPSNIDRYREIIKKSVPEVVRTKVVIKRHGLMFEPWSNWSDSENPSWWRSYNKVKHERNNYYSHANLENVLNSVAALLVVNVYLNHYSICNEIRRNSELYIHSDLRQTIKSLKPVSGFFRIDDYFLYIEE